MLLKPSANVGVSSEFLQGKMPSLETISRNHGLELALSTDTESQVLEASLELFLFLASSVVMNQGKRAKLCSTKTNKWSKEFRAMRNGSMGYLHEMHQNLGVVETVYIFRK